MGGAYRCNYTRKSFRTLYNDLFGPKRVELSGRVWWLVVPSHAWLPTVFFQRPSPLRSSRAPRPKRTCPSSCRDPGGGCTRGTSAPGPRPFPQRPSFWVPLSLLSPSCRCRDPTPRGKGPPPRSCHAPQAVTAHGPPPLSRGTCQNQPAGLRRPRRPLLGTPRLHKPDPNAGSATRPLAPHLEPACLWPCTPFSSTDFGCRKPSCCPQLLSSVINLLLCLLVTAGRARLTRYLTALIFPSPSPCSRKL